jgi:hypothetical protein
MRLEIGLSWNDLHHQSTLDILSLETFVALNEFEVDDFTFVQCFESITTDCCMVHGIRPLQIHPAR